MERQGRGDRGGGCGSFSIENLKFLEFIHINIHFVVQLRKRFVALSAAFEGFENLFNVV